MTRHVGDSVSVATEESATRTVCERRKGAEDVEAENLSSLSLSLCLCFFFSECTINSDITRTTPILADTFLQLPKHKGVLSLLATYTRAPINDRRNKRMWFSTIVRPSNAEHLCPAF